VNGNWREAGLMPYRTGILAARPRHVVSAQLYSSAVGGGKGITETVGTVASSACMTAPACRSCHRLIGAADRVGDNLQRCVPLDIRLAADIRGWQVHALHGARMDSEVAGEIFARF
jgi:hypothetical protein